MSRYYYDLHLHSCLSPCADNDMTPNNIAGMAALAGLQIAALTDHNSCKNCPAFFAACKRYGVVPVAGMELTTAEDIHLICLFEDLEAAMEFDRALSVHRILIRNRTDIFGEQLILDENDGIIGTEEYLLSNATDLSIENAADFARSYGAVVYPAHIDREGNGILAVLGILPEKPLFSAAEFHDAEQIAAIQAKHPGIAGKNIVICSDAHYMEDIPDAKNSVELEDEPYSATLIRRNLLSWLRTEQEESRIDR